MPVSGISAALPAAIRERLATDDDPTLWVEVLRAVAEDVLVLQAHTDRSKLYAVIGSCHWLRPHQSRWTAAGGFALPVGYGDGERSLRGLPNFDWSVTLRMGTVRSSADYSRRGVSTRNLIEYPQINAQINGRCSYTFSTLSQYHVQARLSESQSSAAQLRNTVSYNPHAFRISRLRADLCVPPASPCPRDRST
jgi:hypothetical protein